MKQGIEFWIAKFVVDFLAGMGIIAAFLVVSFAYCFVREEKPNGQM